MLNKVNITKNHHAITKHYHLAESIIMPQIKATLAMLSCLIIIKKYINCEDITANF